MTARKHFAFAVRATERAVRDRGAPDALGASASQSCSWMKPMPFIVETNDGAGSNRNG